MCCRTLQCPFTQKFSILADELLASDADISSSVLAFRDSSYCLAGHTKFERNMSLKSLKKIRNIDSFGLTMKYISFFPNDVL